MMVALVCCYLAKQCQVAGPPESDHHHLGGTRVRIRLEKMTLGARAVYSGMSTARPLICPAFSFAYTSTASVSGNSVVSAWILPARAIAITSSNSTREPQYGMLSDVPYGVLPWRKS